MIGKRKEKMENGKEKEKKKKNGKRNYKEMKHKVTYD